MTEVASSGTGVDWLPEDLRLVQDAAGAGLPEVCSALDRSWLEPADPKLLAIFGSCLTVPTTVIKGQPQKRARLGHSTCVTMINFCLRCQALGNIATTARSTHFQATPSSKTAAKALSCPLGWSCAADVSIDLLQAVRANKARMISRFTKASRAGQKTGQRKKVNNSGGRRVIC